MNYLYTADVSKQNYCRSLTFSVDIYHSATALAISCGTAPSSIGDLDYLTTYPSLVTLEGYKEKMVKKLLHAKNSPPAALFTNKDEFNDWLDNIEKK
jgi:hypothetical protein